jgi:hypothetical protein
MSEISPGVCSAAISLRARRNDGSLHQKSRAFYIIIIKRLLKNVLLSVNYSQTLSLIPLQESKVSTRDISATKSIFLIVLQFIMLNSSAVFTGNR